MTSPKTPLPPELLEKARVELNEVQAEVPEQIQTLREKILENPDFNFRTDDAFLLRFLRARKFDQERTLELIIQYYKERQDNPEFFRKVSKPGLEASQSTKYQGVLPDKDLNGCAIMIYNSMSLWDPDFYTLEALTAHSVLSLELAIEEEATQINGFVIICDMKGLSMKHMLNIGPRTLKKCISIMMNSFPARYKAIHFINEPYLFDALFLMIKQFMSAKLLGRMQFHGGSLESLHQQINPDILPEEFGGTLGLYDNSVWDRALKEHTKSVRKDLRTFGFAGKK